MAGEKRILVYYDELVMTLAKQYSQTMDTHIYSPREILSSIQGLHPVDAVEVVHGRWKTTLVPDGYVQKASRVRKKCSVCGWTNACSYKYCPNCGAKMDGYGNG